MKTTTDYGDFEVSERNDPFIWIEWDKAVKDQDSGFLTLEPFEQAKAIVQPSKRAELRAEFVL